MSEWEKVRARLEGDLEHMIGMEDHKADVRAALQRVEELEQDRAAVEARVEHVCHLLDLASWRG